jgi:lysophospholipase L1-like esterase
MSIIIKPGSRVVFQGDSITDAGRSYEDNANLGLGYPNFVASWLSALYPEHNLAFFNRGISGNRVYDLESRWSNDCIDLKPDWVSVLIGINDTWRRYDSNIISATEEFEASYRRILDRLKAETNAGIILLEPFVLHNPPDRATWREDLDPKIEVVNRLAKDYDTMLIHLDTIFTEAANRREPNFWTFDGVHPTQTGHAFIAQQWIKMVSE